MGILQRLAAQVQGSPYRTGVATIEAERWVRDILIAAAIKKSRSVVIQKTDDGCHLEALIHECGSRACATRMRLIAASQEAPLVALLRQRLDPPPTNGRPVREGRFEDTVAETLLRVTVTFPRSTEPFRLDLSIEPFRKPA